MERCTFKKLLLSFLTLPIFLLMGGCSDVFEDDISEKQVEVLNPLSGFTTTDNLVLFWWNDLEGVNSYNIQIVKGSFQNPEAFIFDSLTENTKLNIPLNTGSYSFRVRGENVGYSSLWNEQSFQVISTSDLSNKTIVFQDGLDTTYSNLSNFQVNWFPIDSIDYYQVKLNLVSNAVVNFLNDSTSNNSFSIQLEDEGLFSISVKAVNEKSETAFSTKYFYYDETSPESANLINPISGKVLGDSSFTFKWTRDLSNNLTGETDSIWISTSNTFQNMIRRDVANSFSYRDSLGKGQFYWRIKTMDQAGNKSYSDVENFLVN